MHLSTSNSKQCIKKFQIFSPPVSFTFKISAMQIKDRYNGQKKSTKQCKQMSTIANIFLLLSKCCWSLKHCQEHIVTMHPHSYRCVYKPIGIHLVNHSQHWPIYPTKWRLLSSLSLPALLQSVLQASGIPTKDSTECEYTEKHLWILLYSNTSILSWSDSSIEYWLGLSDCQMLLSVLCTDAMSDSSSFTDRMVSVLAIAMTWGR